MMGFPDKGIKPYLKGNRSGSGNRKQRPDTKIKKTGKKDGKVFSTFRSQFRHTGRFRAGHGYNRQKGKTHSGNTKAQSRQSHGISRLLPQGYRENQIACPKQHTEEKGGNKKELTPAYIFLHRIKTRFHKNCFAVYPTFPFSSTKLYSFQIKFRNSLMQRSVTSSAYDTPFSF